MKEILVKIFPSMDEGKIIVVERAKTVIQDFCVQYIIYKKQKDLNKRIYPNIHSVIRYHERAWATKIHSYRKSEEAIFMESFKTDPFGNNFYKRCEAIAKKNSNWFISLN